MTMRIIDTIDTRPAEVRDFMAMIETEIAKAFTVPPWMLRNSSAYDRWYSETYRATEILRRQLSQLWDMYPAGLLVSNDGETTEPGS